MIPTPVTFKMLHRSSLILVQDSPNKPLKLLSQQEKDALKMAKLKGGDDDKVAGPPDTADTATKTDVKDPIKDHFLRPSTPINQTGLQGYEDGGSSPMSQACTSGTVTPTSEGVHRQDRNVSHAPPGGLDL